MKPPVSPPVQLLPRRLRNNELGGSAIRRPHDLEVPANPLAHGARKLNLRPLEPHGPNDRRMLVRRDVLANSLAVDADLLDRSLEDLQAGPAVRAGPPVRLLLEARHVR